MKIQLFCNGCGENHEFSLREVEELVYVLQANIADALHHPPDSEEFYDHWKEAPESEMWNQLCLKARLHQDTDAEMYYEHVEGLVESRRANQGVARCDNCGSDAYLPSDGSTPLCKECIEDPRAKAEVAT